MSGSEDTPSIEGSWTHSFEEDEGGVEVYRPTMTFPFPPSRRGRRRLTFTSDDVTESAPGPDDRSQPRGELRRLDADRFGEAGEGFSIVEVSPEVLRLRRG